MANKSLYINMYMIMPNHLHAILFDGMRPLVGFPRAGSYKARTHTPRAWRLPDLLTCTCRCAAKRRRTPAPGVVSDHAGECSKSRAVPGGVCQAICHANRVSRRSTSKENRRLGRTMTPFAQFTVLITRDGKHSPNSRNYMYAGPLQP